MCSLNLKYTNKMNSKRRLKKLIGVYKSCVNVMSRGYSLPLSGGSEYTDRNGMKRRRPVRHVANKTVNYINKVKQMIQEAS